MAKADKNEKVDTKGKKAKAAEKEEAAPEFKYGVQDIADALDLAPASVRVKLRNADIEKAGKSYGWNTKGELKEVIDELKGAGEEKPKGKAKADKDEKPKGKKAKEAEKPAKGKKKPKVEDDD